MPPDIIAGPMVAAGKPPERTSRQAAAGPLGSDPLAALFAALLAHSSGSPPSPGAAPSLLKAAGKQSAPLKLGGDPAEDKTQGKTLSTTLTTLAPLLTPIQIRPIPMNPILPPTAGVSAAQKTTEKTMDTSSAPASPEKEKASVKPSGELPLQEARINMPGASALFPAFLIASPVITSPSPSVDHVAALPVVPGPSASAPALPVVAPNLPRTASVASPGVFALGAAAVPTQTPAGSVSPSSPMTSGAAPAAAPSQPASVDYVPQPQGFSVPVSAVLTLTKLPGDETGAVALPAGTLPVPAPATVEGIGQALPKTAQGLIPALPQALLTVAVQMSATQGVTLEARFAPRPSLVMPLPAAQNVTATNELTVTEGKAAMEGRTATDGESATDGKFATEGTVTTDGQPATEGRVATEGKTLTAGETSKKGLKSAALPADTNTRGQAAPAKTLPADLGFQVIGKRSERRAENDATDALPALPNPVPAQAEAAPTEAKPLTAADRAEMVRQVADGVGAMPLPAKPGASEQMTLQLHPRDWGQLQISVKITPGSHPNAVQAVTAHIVAQTPQVKAALENGSGDLRQALRQAGLHLDRISVTVQRMEASAQAGTTTSGGRHEANQGGAGQGMGSGAFGETTPNQKTGMSDGTGMFGGTGHGMPSFAASGGSHGGRQGGEPPPAYAAAYAPAEPEDALPEAPRRPATGQVDIRA